MEKITYRTYEKSILTANAISKLNETIYTLITQETHDGIYVPCEKEVKAKEEIRYDKK